MRAATSAPKRSAAGRWPNWRSTTPWVWSAWRRCMRWSTNPWRCWRPPAEQETWRRLSARAGARQALGRLAGAAGRGGRVRAHHGRAADHGLVSVGAEHLDRAGRRQHQPGLCARPAVVGADAAFCRRGGRPHRHRARDPARRGAGGSGHVHHAADDNDGGPHLCHRRPGRRGRRHGRAVGAHGGQRAARAAGQARPGHRHRQCGRLLRPVRDGTHRHRPDGRRGLGQRACSGWACSCFWRCRRFSSCAAIPMRWRRRPQPRRGTEGAERPPSHWPGAGHAQLPLSGGGLSGVRLPCGVSGHAPAGGDCRLRAGARIRRLGAGA